MMATYDEAFEVMLETAKENIRQKDYADSQKELYADGGEYVKALYDTADKTMYRLFGQAELCKELFGVSVLQTLHRIERKLDD